GCLVQPASPASAMEAPASLRNVRRETGSTHSEAWRGNSRSSISPNAGCCESSSSVRQYFGPLASASFFRTASSSRLAGLIWLTETRFRFESLLFDIRFHIVSTLTVASGATGYVLRRAQVIFLSQCFAQLKLAGKCFLLPVHRNFNRVLRAGLLVLHVENLLPGTQKLLWLSMAVQAPLHLQGIFLVHQGHLVDRSVTAETANALGDVDAVIEVHKVRQIVNARPLDGLTAVEAEAYGLQHGRVGPYLGVAVHAGLGGRNAGKAGVFHRGMAVTAIQPQALRMVLMAEGDRLLRRNVLSGDVGRALQL